jgi:hypothetical protein
MPRPHQALQEAPETREKGQTQISKPHTFARPPAPHIGTGLPWRWTGRRQISGRLQRPLFTRILSRIITLVVITRILSLIWRPIVQATRPRPAPKGGPQRSQRLQAELAIRIKILVIQIQIILITLLQILKGIRGEPRQVRYLL